MQNFLFIVGVKLNAQIPATHPPGPAAGRRNQRTHNRPRTRGIQDIHLPRVRLHRSDGLPESTREYILLHS